MDRFSLNMVILHRYVKLPEGRCPLPNGSMAMQQRPIDCTWKIPPVGLIFLGLWKGRAQQNMARNMLLMYLHFRIQVNSDWLVDEKRWIIMDYASQ